MTSNKQDDCSSSDSKNSQSSPEKGKTDQKKWFHDSSLTESEALRAMIGKQIIIGEKEAPIESKKRKKDR